MLLIFFKQVFFSWGIIGIIMRTIVRKSVFLSCCSDIQFHSFKGELLLSSQEIPVAKRVVGKRERVKKKHSKGESCGIHWIYALETSGSRQTCCSIPPLGWLEVHYQSRGPLWLYLRLCVMPGWQWVEILWSLAASRVWTKCHTTSGSRVEKVHQRKKCSFN